MPLPIGTNAEQHGGWEVEKKEREQVVVVVVVGWWWWTWDHSPKGVGLHLSWFLRIPRLAAPTCFLWAWIHVCVFFNLFPDSHWKSWPFVRECSTLWPVLMSCLQAKRWSTFTFKWAWLFRHFHAFQGNLDHGQKPHECWHMVLRFIGSVQGQKLDNAEHVTSHSKGILRTGRSQVCWGLTIHKDLPMEII